MEYESAEDTARRWDISVRWVQALCRARRIPGAKRLGRVWLVPKDSVKPVDQRLRPYRSRLSFQRMDEQAPNE